MFVHVLFVCLLFCLSLSPFSSCCEMKNSEEEQAETSKSSQALSTTSASTVPMIRQKRLRAPIWARLLNTIFIISLRTFHGPPFPSPSTHAWSACLTPFSKHTILTEHAVYVYRSHRISSSFPHHPTVQWRVQWSDVNFPVLMLVDQTITLFGFLVRELVVSTAVTNDQFENRLKV